MDLARLARLEDEADLRSGAGADEVVVDRRDGEQRRDRRLGRVVAAVREDDDVVALVDRLAGPVADLLDGLPKGGPAAAHAGRGSAA